MDLNVPIRIGRGYSFFKLKFVKVERKAQAGGISWGGIRGGNVGEVWCSVSGSGTGQHVQRYRAIRTSSSKQSCSSGNFSKLAVQEPTVVRRSEEMRGY